MKRLLVVALVLTPLGACSHSREQNMAAPSYSGTSANSSAAIPAQPERNPNAVGSPTNLHPNPQPGESSGSSADNPAR